MKLSVCILTQNEKDFFLKDCIEEALKIGDEIIVVDGGSKDAEYIADEFNLNKKIKVFTRKWYDSYQYTDQRNFAMEQAMGDYILNLDADEILGDYKYMIKQEIKRRPHIDCWDLEGVHFIYHLGLIDATEEHHIWLHRIVKNNGKIKFPPMTMHGLPIGGKTSAMIPGIQIYHLGYVRQLKNIVNKYKRNMKKLEMHTPQYLKWYKDSHLFGTYPTEPFLNPRKIFPYDRKYPEKLKEMFLLN